MVEQLVFGNDIEMKKNLKISLINYGFIKNYDPTLELNQIMNLIKL